ncbi:MAG: amidohydrolase family protein [Holophagales bacterium]|nr:amidohydrolase family protein [Holophagales bacterium]
MKEALPIKGVIFLLALGCGGISPAKPTFAQQSGKSIAFVGVSLVPIDADRIVPGQIVLVQDGRITAVGDPTEVEIPEDADRIDGGGRFLMPGLVDMHVHIFSEDELPLYLANGVTTVRNMWGWDLHLRLRRQVSNGALEGPTIYTAGALLDGNPPQLRGSAVVETAMDAERVVAEQARAGYDFIKVYNGLSPKAYAAVVLAAREYELPVVGHVPSAVGLHGVLVAGQRSIEHLQGYSTAAASETPATWASRLEITKITKMAAATRRAGVWNTPTLNVLERGDMSAKESEAFLSRPELRYLPSFYRRFCCGSANAPEDDLPEEERALRRANRFLVVKALHDAGAELLLGSDTGNRFVLPGYAIHDEIRLLVEAGLTPYQAIRAGTRNAAVFLGALADLGTIEVGKRADLILVGSNPLKDISTIHRPLGVMARGNWLSSEEIEHRLEGLANKANASGATPSSSAPYPP